ncbi:MAG TPA: BON domain-containing protein [Stellaceae bacterium]|nr:BON domain-containing protein [Stellaceae bacterium]
MALLLSTALGGCAVAVVGGLAAAGGAGYAAGQERGVTGDIDDFKTKNNVQLALASQKPPPPADIGITVYDGRVLLTGTASTPEAKAQAAAAARGAAGVKAVYDQLAVAPPITPWRTAKDAWISTRLRSNLAFDASVKSLNYTIETSDGSVFLMGSARTQGELDRAVAWARNIPDVKRVVSYVEIRPGAPIAAQAAAPPAAVETAPGNPAAAPSTPVEEHRL